MPCLDAVRPGAGVGSPSRGSPAWLVAWHAWGSRAGGLVRPAQGISEGRAAFAVTRGALVVECCAVDRFLTQSQRFPLFLHLHC